MCRCAGERLEFHSGAARCTVCGRSYRLESERVQEAAGEQAPLP
jgi:hypothetical protein